MKGASRSLLYQPSIRRVDGVRRIQPDLPADRR